MNATSEDSVEVVVRVDSDMCVGATYCVAELPEVFKLAGADGVSTVGGADSASMILPIDSADRLREVALGCPTQAISTDEVRRKSPT